MCGKDAGSGFFGLRAVMGIEKHGDIPGQELVKLVAGMLGDAFEDEA